jgi:acetolactate decarboxylase
MSVGVRAAAAAIALASLAALSSCSSTPAGQRPPPKVEHRGAMREMFDDGAAAHVDVAPLLGQPHLYALGPLEKLRGEILVWDGAPFVARVEGGEVRVALDRGAKAPFLVWSRVREWRDVDLPEEARPLAGLTTWIPKAARELKLDAEKPFAFLVIGAVERATIHVHDFPADGTPLTREAHDAPSAKKTIELPGTAVQILGFFAPDAAQAKGVWVHHDSPLHLHLRTPLGTVMGHVDDLTLAPGAIVKFPWR